jgi:hypothetical protein
MKRTHIHFDFASITADFKMDVSAVQAQFDKFIGVTTIKRIIPFGRGSFSTSQDSYGIFREAVINANRQLFAINVCSFVHEHGLYDVIRSDFILDGAFVTSTDKVHYSCNNKEVLATDLLKLLGIEVSWIEFDIISDIADGCWGSSNPCTSHILR